MKLGRAVAATATGAGRTSVVVVLPGGSDVDVAAVAAQLVPGG